MDNIQKRDFVNIFIHWCKIGSSVVDALMSDDNSELLPWHFTGRGNTGVMFKCIGSDFPMSILTCKATGAKWHASVITAEFILKFREIVRNFQACDTQIEILRLQDMFDGTRFESKFYDRLATLHHQGPIRFYQKIAVLRATIETIFIQTGTVSGDLITELDIQTGSNLRADLVKLVCFPQNIQICISAASEKKDAVMATAKISAITFRDASAMLFFSDSLLQTFSMPLNIKYIAI